VAHLRHLRISQKRVASLANKSDKRHYRSQKVLGLCRRRLRLQRKKRAAFMLKSGLVRLMIGQPFAFAALDRFNRPLSIADLAIVVAEIEFCQIAVQMLFAAMLVNPAHTRP
jgi:hypothetical protein